MFTTHATVLGRALASSNVQPAEIKGNFDADSKAREIGIQTKHQTEKMCAHNADVFTTVSEITGMEAEQILKKKPDVLTLNGLDMNTFPTFEEASLKHRRFRTKFRDFCLAYFFPYQTFDLANTLFYFIAGRYEFKDKGIDVFIRSLGKLNERLKRENNPRNIVVFLFVPGYVKGTNFEVVENISSFQDIEDSMDDHKEDIINRIMISQMSRKQICDEEMFDENLRAEMKRKVKRLLKEGVPRLCTHDLGDENNDAIMQELKKNNLNNDASDKVKVVYYPIYLTGADNLLNTNYYESIHACHLGVFPSFYEPWGYTPLESGALGIASVTTDLAGFGRFVDARRKKNSQGIFVIKRMGKNDDAVVEELAEVLFNFSQQTKHGRVENKMAARKIAETCDWSKFVDFYIEAHNMAFER